MKKCLPTCVALLVCCVPLRADAESVSPKKTEKEPHWQLFLDDYIIERSTGFRRVVHHPRPRGIVIPADRPWENWGITPKYIGRRKDGMLECYYEASWWRPGFPDPGRPVDPVVVGLRRHHMAYAVSKDGVHWEKPMLKLVGGPWGKQNNFVPFGPPLDLGRYGNVADPARRFAIMNDDQPEHGVYFCSEPPDFTGDPHWRKKLVFGGTKPSLKLSPPFWDDTHQEWVFMGRIPAHPPTLSAARWSTKDLKKWTLKPVLYPDASDSTDPLRFESVAAMCAIYTEGLVLGYAKWYIGDHTRPDLSVLEEELIGRLYNKGPRHVRVTVSRDWGYTWDRTVSREAWIPHGAEPDSYDRDVGMYAAPLRMGEEDWFYCAATDGDHLQGMGYYRDREPKIQGVLYTQKHNRYVSLTAGNSPQILITNPLKVTGKTLQLNVDASRGEVKVGIGIDKRLRIPNAPPGDTAVMPSYMVRDRQGRTHLEEGFRIKDCQPVHVNRIEHNVQWKDASLGSLEGRTVRLYIMVQDADLYGFRFK